MPTTNLTEGNDTHALDGEYETGLMTVNGRGGNDSIIGSWDDDTLNGNEGADTLAGEDGNDVLNGGGGSDVIYAGGYSGTFNYTGFDLIHGNGGNDIINGANSTDADGEFYGDGGADIINAHARGGYYFISGGAQNDMIQTGQTDSDAFFDAFGDEGNDTIEGVGGENYFAGGDGNDNLRGSFGSFILDGEDGDDHLELGSFASGTLEGGMGDDTLVGNAQRSSFIMRGGEGNDVLQAIGNIGNIDEVYEGGEGDDVITSLDANDAITGGDGHDDMTGGNGNDRFIFTARDESYGDTSSFSDVIRDFASGDKVSFEGLSLTFESLVIEDSEGGATISYQDNVAENTILLAGVEASSLSESSFLFS